MSAVLQLPDECWETVFRFLCECHHRYLEPVSLVSKQFLSITNHLRLSLTICDPTVPYLHHLFLRYRMLQSLDLTCFSGDLNMLLHKISRSALALNSLNISNNTRIPADGLRALGKMVKTLKSLSCSNMGSLTNADLLLIADCFPFLEELDISFPRDLDKIFIIDYKNFDNHTGPISDFGIKVLSLALPKLRMVNLSGNYFINDSSLFNLCKNCEFLEQVQIFGCDFITQVGIAAAFRERPNLTSLSVSNFGRANIASDFIGSLVSLKSLTCIDLTYSCISDELLFSIAEAGLPLRKLILRGCSNYSYAGISCLLSKCQVVEHLDLMDAEFLDDKLISELSVFLGNLMYIYLSGCRMLTNSSFFALTRNCPLLNEVTMEETSIGENGIENTLTDFTVVHSQVKSLHLANSSKLRDESVKKIASICPNLQLLDLSSCWGISEVGVVEVLKRCCKITHLSFASCLLVKKLLGMNFEAPKLEELTLSRSGVDDDALLIISKSCCGLLDMNMENCSEITDKGVKKVVENCIHLRTINLKGCYKVSADIVAWMVFSRPSLRKISAPPRFRPSDGQKELFLRHGCFVT
ncbi:unnamed protein product [Lupinus luteus]|uniref:F-box/LRR-repeat protein 15-like leucin rich repeat domain-containing protein n=1 Tax=Lupinus luteus TaxID=3873 RepID=A0AAV1YQU9_LUPLU